MWRTGSSTLEMCDMNTDTEASSVLGGSKYASVAVLVPCYNEAQTVAKVVDDFRRVLPGATVYVYDNNSSDGTAEIAARAGAVVRKECRQGKGNVVRQMLRDIDSEYYIMVDGDDTYPAEAAPDLLSPLMSGESDTVVGDRLSNGTYGAENKRAMHGFGNNLVRDLVSLLYGYRYNDIMTGYRSFNRVFAKTLPVLSDGFQIETELSIHAADKRWRIAQVPIDYRDRPAGSESKLDTVSDGMRVLAMIVVGLSLGGPVIIDFVRTGLVPRLPTAIVAVALCGLAALLFVCGVILDTVVKGNRRQWELEVMREYEKQSANTDEVEPCKK